MLRTAIFTGAIGIVFFAVERLGFGSVLPSEKWFILAFFFAVYVFQHRLLEFGTDNDNKSFIQFFMASTVFRLVLSVVFVGLFLYFGIKNTKTFIITFIVLYLFYTCFEIYGISTKLRRDLKP
jgi:hypothetical protein